VLENPFSGTIELFDITGKLVYSNRCENILEKTIHLNLNEGVFSPLLEFTPAACVIKNSMNAITLLVKTPTKSKNKVVE